MARKLSVPGKDELGRFPRTGVGPQIGFAAAILLSFVALTAARVTLPPEAVIPAIATLLLVLAGAFGLIAWRHREQDPTNVTYVDVAGVLTLIGLCAAATIDPEQMVGLVNSRHTVD